MRTVEFELYDEEKESSLLNAENLTELGFKKSENIDEDREYELGPFIVGLTDDEECPDVRIYQGTESIKFPGAYKLKELKTLMFFYLDEDGYSKLIHG